MEFLSDVLPFLTLVLGWALAHWSAIHRDTKKVVVEKRAEYVTDFLAQGYTNLRYIVDPEDSGQQAGPIGDFTVMGLRAALYVSDSAAKEIDDFTTIYARSVVKLGRKIRGEISDNEDHFKIIKTDLDKLRASLRSEIGVT